MPAQEGGTALDALIDAAAGILAADSLQDTLARIAHHLRALLPYDDLTVYEVDADAFVCVPMLAHDRVVGTLNVYRVGADRAYTDAEVALVERFATMAALAYEAARQREHLRHQAATDGLTGLLNHRGAQERLRRETEAAATAGRELSVVVVDLDHFKRINDSFGHAEGDKALR